MLCWWMDIPDRERADPAALQGRPSRWPRVRRGVRVPLPHLTRCGTPPFWLTYAGYGRVRPTGLKPATFSRATIRRHLFPGVAVRCRIGVSKPFSLLAVAPSFCVLRAEWCQRWCQQQRYPAWLIFMHASHML
jgi:hypothetical protein